MKWFLMIFAFSLCVMAQEAQPVPAQPAVTDQIIGKLQDVDSKIPVSLPEAAVSVLVALSAIAVRVYPTSKSWCLIFTPLSVIFGLISSIFNKLKQGSEFLASVFNNKSNPPPQV